MSDWGALGVQVGRQLTNYWLVPVFAGLETPPDPDGLKQLGATLASYGSLAMFHLVGVTPEAPTAAEAFGGRTPRATIVVAPGDLDRTYRSFAAEQETVDLVVCSGRGDSVIARAISAWGVGAENGGSPASIS